MENTIETPELRGTYSPEDNKLRFYSSERLSKEDYLRFKDIGFKYAPKQKLFVAPMWTPSRYDFLLSYVGSVEPEEITAAERAEQRAERFEGYQEKRLNEAHEYKERAQEIAGDLSSPQLLIAHHSRDKAEKQARKLKATMEKAVDKWETSKYWEYRTEGVIANVTYKDKADVRARRIKKLNAEMRKHERNIKDYEKKLKHWLKPDLDLDYAWKIGNIWDMKLPLKEGDTPPHDHMRTTVRDALHPETFPNNYYSYYAPRTLQEIIDHAEKAYSSGIAYQERWLNHYKNRIAYETAVLNAQGGAYLLEPAARPKQLPLMNIDAPLVHQRKWDKEPKTHPVHHMTKEEYKNLYSDSKHTQDSLCGLYRQKVAAIPKEGEPSYMAKWHVIFLTDAKTHDKPA